LAAFENKRSFTSVGNACAVVEQLCQGKVSNGIYPLCDDEPVSTNRLIELIAESLGRRARLWHFPRNLLKMAAKVGDWTHLPLNSERLGKLTETARVDNSKLKAALGWEKMPVRAEDGFRITLLSFAEAARRS
jgi:nucleoside-diphosphate-sugar epimerase